MIKVIIFDLGSVCFRIDWLKLNDEMVNKFGISTLITSNYGADIQEVYYQTLAGKKNMEDVFTEICKLKNIKRDVSEICAFYKEAYKRHRKPNKKLMKLIEKLKEKYEIICLSDTNKIHFESHQEQGLLKHFSKVFTSFELGSRKSDKNTFIKVLEQVKVKPEETLFIDDYKTNVDNAKSLGINAIKYENYNQLVKELKHLKII